MAVAVMAAAIIMAVAGAVIVITPGKGCGKNPKKSSPRKKKGFPLGLLMQKGTQVGVISVPINALPT